MASDGTTSGTRPTTRSSGERSGRSDTVQGRQNHGRHWDANTSRSSLASTRGNGSRPAEQYDSRTQGHQVAQGDDDLEPEEPCEEPPNQIDQPSGQHLQVSLTGRRRRFALDPPWEAWFAESSQCFHRRRECRRLRKANRVRGHPICGICQQSTREQNGLGAVNFIYEDQVGNFHTDARCKCVTGAMLEIRQCKLCKDSGLS